MGIIRQDKPWQGTQNADNQRLSDCKKPEDIPPGRTLLKKLTKAILAPSLAAAMTEHWGNEKHDPTGHHQQRKYLQQP